MKMRKIKFARFLSVLVTLSILMSGFVSAQDIYRLNNTIPSVGYLPARMGLHWGMLGPNDSYDTSLKMMQQYDFDNGQFIGTVKNAFCIDSEMNMDESENYGITDLTNVLAADKALEVSKLALFFAKIKDSSITLNALTTMVNTEYPSDLPVSDLTIEDVITSFQYAIWYYTSGVTEQPSDYNCFQVYKYLLDNKDTLPIPTTVVPTNANIVMNVVSKMFLPNGDYEVKYTITTTGEGVDSNIVQTISSPYQSLVPTYDNATNVYTLIIPCVQVTSAVVDITISATVGYSTSNVYAFVQAIPVDAPMDWNLLTEGNDSQPLVGWEFGRGTINNTLNVTDTKIINYKAPETAWAGVVTSDAFPKYKKNVIFNSSGDIFRSGSSAWAMGIKFEAVDGNVKTYDLISAQYDYVGQVVISASGGKLTVTYNTGLNLLQETHCGMYGSINQIPKANGKLNGQNIGGIYTFDYTEGKTVYIAAHAVVAAVSN